MTLSLGVFCSSSNHIAPSYFEATNELGRLIARDGWTLLYGGGGIGLMGELARAVHGEGGRVVGVIPERLKAIEGVAYDVADELIVTDTMRERKRIIYDRSDAFVVLPGGFGTMEEFLEVLTLKHLGYHEKPIVLMDTDDYFQGLLSFFDTIVAERFALERRIGAFHRTESPAEIVSYLRMHTVTGRDPMST